MNKRGRSKSRADDKGGRKASKSASRAGKSPKAAKKTEKAPKSPKKRQSRSRTRERKSVERTRDQSRRSRSRSESVSKSKEARPSLRGRPKRQPEVKKFEEPMKRAEIVINDVMRDSRDLNDIVRRSLDRDVGTDDSVRRTSRRIAGRVESWSKKTVIAESEEETKPAKVEFGGWLGALFQIAMMVGIVVFTMFGCTREQCELKPFHIPRNWHLYLNPQSAGIVLGFFLLQLVLLVLPVGRIVKMSNGSAPFRSNGVLALFLTGATIAGLWYAGFPVTIVYERWVSLITSTYILGWLMATILFIKGGRASLSGLNPYGNTGNMIYDFYVGREIHPVILKKVNMKLLFLRCGLIGCITLDSLMVLKGWEVRKEISPTLLASAVMHIIYCFDALWFEESLTSTFEAQYEGTGLMTANAYTIFPFFSAVIPKFILAYRVELSPLRLAISALVYLVGMFIYRASNLQKSAFRKNPHDPTVSSYDTIPTSTGKKLLVGGWWGLLKHPNYLGDIILLFGWALTVGFTHSLPYLVPLGSTLLLVHRAQRDFKRCQLRYRAAWDEYHRRVPYSIVPYVY